MTVFGTTVQVGGKFPKAKPAGRPRRGAYRFARPMSGASPDGA